MILANLGNDLSGPDLLVNELLPIKDADDEVNGSPKNDGLLLCDVQVEVKWVLVVGVETEWEFPLLNSLNSLRVGIDLIDTKPKLISRVGEHDLNVFDLQKLVILNSDGAADIKNGGGWFHIVEYAGFEFT